MVVYDMNARCFYCGVLLTAAVGSPTKPTDRTIDHVIPRCRGGPRQSIRNLVWCCLRCNQVKGSKSLRRFKNRMFGGREFYGLASPTLSRTSLPGLIGGTRHQECYRWVIQDRPQVEIKEGT